MQKPSDNWKRTRRATLERAQRTLAAPLTPLCTICSGAIALVLAVFLCLNLFHFEAGFGWFTTCLIISSAAAGALLPFLVVAILTLELANKKMDHLVGE